MENYDGVKGSINLSDPNEKLKDQFKETTGLYYIRDKLSKLRITNFMEFPNDVVACKSFCAFIAEKTDDDKNFYELYKAAAIFDLVGVQHVVNNSYKLTNGATCKEDLQILIDEQEE